MDQNQQFIEYHDALMKLSHDPDFISDNRQDKLAALVHLVGTRLNIDRVGVWRMNGSDTAIDSEILFQLNDGTHNDGTRLDQALNPAYFRALLRARVIDASDARNDQRTRDFNDNYLRPLGIHSLLDAPIFDEGRLSGILCLETLKPRQWTLPEMSFATAIADTISLINTHEAWRLSQQELDYITHFDDLTGLPNLRSLRERLQHLTHPATSENLPPFALIWVDLDRLKSINDGMGQMVGNQVITEVADRLRNLFIPGKDKIARCGGDEFALLIRNRMNTEELHSLAETIRRTIAQPIRIAGHALQVGSSLGISRFPLDGKDAASLLKHSEAAMYHAKESGRGQTQIFHTDLSADARSRFLMESQLRSAILNHELDVFYQPIVDASDQRLVMVEALVRWHHDAHGWLAPGRFLDLARAGGLMVELGEAVMHRIGRDCARAREQGIRMPVVAVNLASEQLLEVDLPERLNAILSKYGLSGRQFEFEVTEDAIKADSETLQDILQRLVELGAQLSIDDFGTGYSSLARLKHLPVSKLKIDRSFIRDLPSDADDCAITLSILGLAKGLGLSVVAEGVETQAQEAWLMHQDCDFLQGYRYSRPVPFDRLLPGFLHVPDHT
ncbi:putative bifunctional diguanylate cyclase/phosphodiesterase [Saccharospirillum salsuginis]|uniref:Diguanylate cyclase (GGDEF) domain-containing protein n=1 Tax=Saccharospirillum salsuginis TaxID=418750 RepID=A0A918NH40_9GAMM|nr:EAL domain-containing protein [Saccharospirillum salsuginis]GGX72705.1 hypothetical protein GCM10007392_45020 [Saccharospirillum salsuginis]